MAKYRPINNKDFNEVVGKLLEARIYKKAKKAERWELEMKTLLKNDGYSIEKYNIAKEEYKANKAVENELKNIFFVLFKGRYE